MIDAGIEYFFDSPGSFVSPYPKKDSDKENIYYEMVAGDTPYINAWMIDITNYDGKLKPYNSRGDNTEENIALINFSNRYSNKLVPIYEVIEDTQIKEEVQKEYTKYLCE